MAKDPVCGMQVNEKSAKFRLIKGGKTYYFCSEHCRNTFAKENPKSNYAKFIPAVLVATLLFFSIFSYVKDFMPKFMGAFFIIVAILKMLDWRGFAGAFEMYDILAKRSRAYSLAYPAIELLLGLMFLFNFKIFYAAIITFFIMSIGTIGVARNLLSKNPVKCACLGTLINIPLTKFTLFEDLLMAVMALLVLIM